MKKNIGLLLFFICTFFNCTFAQSAPRVDVLIRDAWVFDGGTGDSVKTDVGIIGDKISYLGNSRKDKITATKIIDATGLYLAPGFIDPHTHYSRWVDSKKAEERANMPCLSQGVTTAFLGSDGGGTYLIKKKMDAYRSNGIGTNVALFVGFGSVRNAVLGNKDVTPSEEELKKEEDLVASAMEEGALGLSTGLFYAPQSYSKTPEVIALSKIAAKYGGVYDTPMRSESDDLVKAVKEVITIGKMAQFPVHISHIKCLGPSAWGKSDEVIGLIKQAQADNIHITASQYPYIASHTSLSAMLIPRWVQSGGSKMMLKRFENADTLKKIMKELSVNLAIRGGDSRITLTSDNAQFSGKTLHQVASDWKIGPEEAAVRILKEEPGISANSFSMLEDDLDNFMIQPWVMTGSDGGGDHPRTYGTFTRVIRKYVLEEKLLSMTQAIHRATGETATLFGLAKRGFIRKGYYADIVIFNPHAIKDNATFADSKKMSSGIEYVIVNGKIAIVQGNYTGVLAGQPLRKVPFLNKNLFRIYNNKKSPAGYCYAL